MQQSATTQRNVVYVLKKIFPATFSLFPLTISVPPHAKFESQFTPCCPLPAVSSAYLSSHKDKGKQNKKVRQLDQSQFCGRKVCKHPRTCVLFKVLHPDINWFLFSEQLHKSLHQSGSTVSDTFQRVQNFSSE